MAGLSFVGGFAGDDPAPPLVEVGADERTEACARDVENEESVVEVNVDRVGTNATPLLVGVTVTSDTKMMEVISTVVWLERDVGDATSEEEKGINVSKNVDDEAAARFGVDVEAAAGSVNEDGMGSAEISPLNPVVVVSALLPDSLWGQPERLHGSTWQQPLKLFELHV